MRKLLLTAMACLGSAGADARDCAGDTAPTLVAAQFTSAVRSQQPQDRLLYLPPDAREVFIHASTRGTGTITYRWFRDGKRVIDVAARVGDGEWHTWSRLRLPPPVPAELRVLILGPDNCTLREMTLAATALVDEPAISKAWQQLAAMNPTGAKITLNMALEAAPPRSALTRAARRMLDIDVAIAMALQRAHGDELFLVEPALKDVERRLGRTAADRAARDRIREVRSVAAARRQALASEGNLTALATRHLFETEKLFSGDYPLWREDAEKLLAPALLRAGDSYAMLDWKPTLRGYRLVLQDKRTGEPVEVTSD